MQKNFESNLDNIKIDSKGKINKIIKDFILEMNKNFDLSNLLRKILEITVNIFYCFCYFSPNIQVDINDVHLKGKIDERLDCEISQKTLLNIQELLNEYLNKFIHIYYNNLEKLENKYAKEIIIKLINLDLISF